MSIPENPFQNKLANQSINYWKIIRILLSRWYWVAATLLISYIAAQITIFYTEEIFYTEASLKLDNGDQSQFNSPVSPLSYRYLKNNQIETEGVIMRSEDVVLNAIKTLDYKITYYLEGRIRTSELYPNKPFKINIIQQDSVDFSREIYHVKPVSATTFMLGVNKQYYETYSYGQVIEMGKMLFSITTPIPTRGSYSFQFKSARDFLGRAIGGLNTEEAQKNTNIMRVSHTDKSPRFSADLLNAIIRQYVTNDAEQKKRSAIQTINYLDNQINALDTSVNKSGDNLASFQTRNKIFDPVSDKQNNAGKIADFQKQIADLQLQAINIRQMETEARNNNGQTLLSLNFDATSSAALATLVADYNKIVQERIEKLKSFQPIAKPITDLDNRLQAIKKTIVSNILLLKDRNQKSLNFVSAQLGETNSKLNQLPAQQNDFTKLQNKYNINNQMASMLFERKLSAQIARAAVIPGATILSVAEPGQSPISPVERKIYTSYMFLGLLAGLGLILLVRILNPYIYDAETVEGLTATPIIGVILKYPEKIQTDFKRILSLDKPKSVFAESVRSVRTNLSFMASQKDTKVIAVTSEISGEGKSFVTVNLAGTLAIIDKKVIVIAADLRRSKLHKTFGSDNKKGLSTYLSLKDGIDDIIGRDEDHYIDFITSGPVPPNPSELLHSPKMQELIDILSKRYEYILIDTAPVGLVSDSIPLIRKADINLFIIRSGVSKFRAATIPDRLSKEYSLNNIAIILNSFGDEKTAFKHLFNQIMPMEVRALIIILIIPGMAITAITMMAKKVPGGNSGKNFKRKFLSTSLLFVFNLYRKMGSLKKRFFMCFFPGCRRYQVECADSYFSKNLCS